MMPFIVGFVWILHPPQLAFFLHHYSAATPLLLKSVHYDASPLMDLCNMGRGKGAVLGQSWISRMNRMSNLGERSTNGVVGHGRAKKSPFICTKYNNARTVCHWQLILRPRINAVEEVVRVAKQAKKETTYPKCSPLASFRIGVPRVSAFLTCTL